MTRDVVMVASPGGHVDQAYEIAGRFAERSERFWITARTPQTEALLADERVVWVPEVRSRQGFRAAKTLGIARRIMQLNQPRQLVSTGSALAVPYILAARAARIPVTYVESATRLLGPSVTGRIVERVPGIQRFYQGTEWDRSGWTSFGSIFDRYVAELVDPAPVRRALVTIGSEKFPFPRAIQTILDASPAEEWAWQTGNTAVDEFDLPGEARQWWPGDELAARARESDIVITHAGVGSILMVLRTGACPVVICRMQHLGEHIDDHQVELSEMLEKRGLVVVVRPGDDVAEAVRIAAGRRIGTNGLGAVAAAREEKP